MPICFVIQPFDGDKFDRRYDETFRPAVEGVGLEAYRVDQDPSVEVPIEEIERKIRDATICLADVSMDNPNVWYELGYAFALKKKVVLVCSDERQSKFPFDIQHRAVVQYETGSSGDYERLRNSITERAKALLDHKEKEEVAQVEKGEQEGTLSDLEIQVLRIAIEDRPVRGDQMSVRKLHEAAIGRGISSIGFNVAVQRLRKRGFLDEERLSLYGIEDFEELCVNLTEACWDWIGANMHLFGLDEGGALRET